jgi:hypothetical protein
VGCACLGARAVLGAGAGAKLGNGLEHACLPVGGLAVQLEELPGITGEVATVVPSKPPYEPLLPYKKVVTCIRWQYLKQLQVL